MFDRSPVTSIVGKRISGMLYLHVDGGRRHSLILTFDDDSHVEFYSYANIHPGCCVEPGGFSAVMEDAHQSRSQLVEFATPHRQAVLQE